MEDGKQLWSIWQRLLACFSEVFTRPGWVRFAQWLSGMVLCDEEHTITQEVTSLGMTERWRNFEHFAEYGAFNQRAVEHAVMNIIERQHPCRFGRYHPVAVDDTKELRASRHVWGTCTFKHVSSRNPKHPKLVMAHNWVVMGDLAPGDKNQPWMYLPTASRLYLRATQLPSGETFRTKNDMAVEMLRQSNTSSAAPVLGVFDGGYARANVVRPCLQGTERRIEVLTRPRSDARLYQPLPPERTGRRKPKRGRRRKWGQRFPAPRNCDQWKGVWREGKAYVYGQLRRFRYKAMDCRWSVSGPDMPMQIFAFKVEGYQEPWCIITSALDLSAAQVLEAYAARFRQEDGIRDHKQRLGMEEVRAWTKAPVLRTFQMQLLSITLLRLMQWELGECWGKGWCSPPPWNPHKKRVSILDLRRLMWKHRSEFSQFLQEMDEVKKSKPAA